jgi:hypothetical protein
MTDDQILVHRVLNAVPARSYAMNALLSLLRVEVSRDVPTAAISCERRPVLRVNPDFVREHCRTDEHLFLLVMHELYHMLLGHTRLFPRVTPAHNLAFDAVINALLALQHPERAYTSFFLDLYGRESGVLRLLAPPDGVALAGPTLAALHQLLYGSGQTTSEEVFHAVVRTGQAVPGADGTDAPILLGSHGGSPLTGDDDDGWGTAGPIDPTFVEAVREIVERWPPPDSPIRGRSLSDLLGRDRVAQAPVGRRVRAAVRLALLAAATPSRSSISRGAGLVRAQVVVPELRDRRGAVLRAAGRTPLFYDSAVYSPRGRHEGQARVYFDVSGSMDGYIPHLYAALASLRDHIQPQVGLFSTKVVTVPLADMVRGRADTTGGTDIGCVVDDIVARRPRRVLLITDGYVGRVSPADVARVGRAGVDVRVLLTPDGWRPDLAQLASRVDELPDLQSDDAWKLMTDRHHQVRPFIVSSDPSSSGPTGIVSSN